MTGFKLGQHLQFKQTWLVSNVISPIVDSPISETLVLKSFWSETGILSLLGTLFFFGEAPGGKFIETSPSENFTVAWRGERVSLKTTKYATFNMRKRFCKTWKILKSWIIFQCQRWWEISMWNVYQNYICDVL